VRNIFFLISIFLSFNTFAGYECHLSIFHTEDLHTAITEKTFFMDDSGMKTNIHEDFVIESQMKNRKTSIDLRTFTVGWRGEEEVTLVAFRNFQEKNKNNLESISNKVSLRGDSKDTLWFDSYKLDIECKVI
jgi:hypothetical protein